MRRGARIPSSISRPRCATTPSLRRPDRPMMPLGQEIALRAVGTALAGLSVTFAGYMLANGDGRIRVNGMEHLAIFAQPRGGASAAKPLTLPTLTEPTRPPEKPLDMSTTGSIGAGSAQVSAPQRVEIVA